MKKCFALSDINVLLCHQGHFYNTLSQKTLVILISLLENKGSSKEYPQNGISEYTQCCNKNITFFHVSCKFWWNSRNHTDQYIGEKIGTKIRGERGYRSHSVFILFMVTCNLALHLYPLENLLGVAKWLTDVKVVNIDGVRHRQF